MYKDSVIGRRVDHGPDADELLADVVKVIYNLRREVRLACEVWFDMAARVEDSAESDALISRLVHYESSKGVEDGSAFRMARYGVCVMEEAKRWTTIIKSH